ncbi:hypothetical protein MTR67_023180 [Solanum verrucosum]|uniref:Uncharacterized protein n=1 Tax=Solanum verrucosum TaxID=315347 RepID=A0AAF0QVZ0_SOLVR|nr:hypothetical protein MTR67_023180 [Solanum verrucosum]
MISKGCVYHLVWVRDTDFETPNLVSIIVVNHFLEVPDVPDIPPKREINFGIHLLLDMQPIYIPPYRMAPVELKELKDLLNDLLDKGFVRPSISRWGSPVLFVCRVIECNSTCLSPNPHPISFQIWSLELMLGGMRMRMWNEKLLKMLNKIHKFQPTLWQNM